MAQPNNGSGHRGAAILLPGFAINWEQNQVPRHSHLREPPICIFDRDSLSWNLTNGQGDLSVSTSVCRTVFGACILSPISCAAQCIMGRPPLIITEQCAYTISVYGGLQAAPTHHFQVGYQPCQSLGLYSLSGRTSYRKISWSLEATRFGFRLFQSLWILTGSSAAVLPRCLSNFKAIR